MMADTEPARQSRTSRENHMAWLLVGLAAAARLPRDPRFQRRLIMLAIGLAAAADLARNSESASLARLLAWDRRQQMRALRAVKRQSSTRA
jgi:hypothetical protein